MSERTTVEELRAAGERPASASRPPTRARGARAIARVARLEPRDAGGILDLGIEGLLARLGPALAVALAFWVPFRQIEELLGLSEFQGSGLGATLLVSGILEAVPRGAVVSVVVSLIGDALADRNASIAAGVQRGLARAPGAIALVLLMNVLALPLLALCVAPYFVALWLTWAAIPIYVLEGDTLLGASVVRDPLAFVLRFPTGVARAITRSVRLSWSRGALARWGLLAIVGQLFLGLLLEAGAHQLTQPESREYLRETLGLGGNTAGIALGSVAALFTALSSCVRGALVVAFYLDLRVRHEGFDLELALERASAS